jgi:translation initiation factor 1
MGKKTDTRKTVATDANRPLKHSPFTSLGGVDAQPSTTQVSGSAEAAPTSDSSPQPSAASEPEHRKSRGRLVLRRETKHRGGKAVIVVSGFDAAGVDDAALSSLAAELKRTLGCGGTVDHGERGREIVLQGNQAAEVARLLTAQGFRVAGVTA